MAGRGGQTFLKRQKEQQRKEKQQEKIARRQQRKTEKETGGGGPIIEAMDESDLGLGPEAPVDRAEDYYS